MPITHTITTKVTTPGSEVSAAVELSGDLALSVDESIADSSTDVEIPFSVDVAKLQSLYIRSDQAITIETNSGAAPDDTLSIAANVPLVWYDGCGHDCPLTVDVTGLFITNASGAAAALRIEALVDQIT